MRYDNIAMLNDTLAILDQGYYEIEEQTVGQTDGQTPGQTDGKSPCQTTGRRIPLRLSRQQMEEAHVYLPADVRRIAQATDFEHIHVYGRSSYFCENIDSFGLARRWSAGAGRPAEGEDQTDPGVIHRKRMPVLVLNLANPVHPGGGVRNGATAQEEDLCRKSSLLLSLEGREAASYYEYNRSLNTYMGSDALIIHPQVEIIKDENGRLLPESVIVAVLTCAAPMLARGMEGMSPAQYEAMMLGRISGMLKTAAYLGYKDLVLGAFGCGAFRNDARIVSDLFYKALKEFNFDGMREYDMFNKIGFAVLDRTESQYNFREFDRNFNHFYDREDQAMIDEALAARKATEVHLDAIRGCIFGGAVGDALGYPVEFLQEEDIFAQYGPRGITAYEKDPYTGKALISDDTQMSLFTANGLLVGQTRGELRGIAGPPRAYVEQAYRDWLMTQTRTMEEVNRHKRISKEGGFSWLLDVPELYNRRAPGNTCLSALSEGRWFNDYIAAKRNESKGCGGVMRVAPLGVCYEVARIAQLDREGAQLAAITHGNSLGYMPAAVLVHIINRIVFPPKGAGKEGGGGKGADEGKGKGKGKGNGKPMSLKDIVLEARDTAADIFAGDENLPVLIDIIDRAVQYAEEPDADDLDCIHRLGEGWVAEETLGIALYCALRHSDDFSAGIIAAVNHNGDSDSTGAVTGNILGALLGYDAIENQWKQDLELSDVILETADDLCHGCQMSEGSAYTDPDWIEKYIHMHRPTQG